MKLMRFSVLALIAASLSGCVANEETFNKNRPIIASRPELRAKLENGCTQRIKYTNSETKRYMAGFMHTSLDGLPGKVCGRIMRGYLNGRIGYRDLILLTKGEKFTPNMIAVLRAN